MFSHAPQLQEEYVSLNETNFFYNNNYIKITSKTLTHACMLSQS